MVTIGPTRWFVRFSRQQQRGGRTQYDLSLVPEAKSYLISKVTHNGLDDVLGDVVLPVDPIPVTAWLNLWEAHGKEEANLAKSLCQELAAQAVGEALRLQLFRPIELEKYARQLLVQEGLLLALQKPIEEFEQVDQIDIREDLRLVIEARRRNEEIRTREQLEASERAFKLSMQALNRSLDLLYENLTPELVEEAKQKKTITIKKNGDSWVIPLQCHGLVRRYKENGKLVGKYCLVFEQFDIPYGDEALMKMILIKSDLKRFLSKANFFPSRR